MSDGALAVSKAFVDPQTGVTISAVSQGIGGLTVSVASPLTHGDPGIYRKLSPTGGRLQVHARLGLDSASMRSHTAWRATSRSKLHVRRPDQPCHLPQRHLVPRHQRDGTSDQTVTGWCGCRRCPAPLTSRCWLDR
jgi:hypothetical protein